MHIQEIRWGNIIGSKGNPEGWRVYSTDFEFINDNPNDYFGIPLSPEWLERFGFECSKEISAASGNTVSFDVYRKNGFVFNSIQDAYWYNGQLLVNQPNYIHQLQNLHYILTGKELELKP